MKHHISNVKNSCSDHLKLLCSYNPVMGLPKHLGLYSSAETHLAHLMLEICGTSLHARHSLGHGP